VGFVTSIKEQCRIEISQQCGRQGEKNGNTLFQGPESVLKEIYHLKKLKECAIKI
jgi:hypothetical protein